MYVFLDIHLQPAVRVVMAGLVMKLVRDEEGATALEYALLASLVAGVIFGAVTLLGKEVSRLFDLVYLKMGVR